MKASQLLPLRGPINALSYALLAPTLLFSQHIVVASLFTLSGASLEFDAMFWLLPLRRLIE